MELEIYLIPNSICFGAKFCTTMTQKRFQRERYKVFFGQKYAKVGIS